MLHFSQLSDWWIDAAYLDYRTPVVINSSPSMIFPRYDFRGTSGQVEHAAKVISAMLDYKIDIDKYLPLLSFSFGMFVKLLALNPHALLCSETLPVEKLGNRPLCMDQYYKVLSSCRIPGVKRDEVENYTLSWRPPQHIVVAKNNQVIV